MGGAPLRVIETGGAVEIISNTISASDDETVGAGGQTGHTESIRGQGINAIIYIVDIEARGGNPIGIKRVGGDFDRGAWPNTGPVTGVTILA